jgi:hypothetical protein
MARRRPERSAGFRSCFKSKLQLLGGVHLHAGAHGAGGHAGADILALGGGELEMDYVLDLEHMTAIRNKFCVRVRRADEICGM